MKKFISFALIVLLFFGCACAAGTNGTVIKDRKTDIYKQYKDYLNDFQIDDVKRSADKNEAEYEFRVFLRPDGSNNYYYYNIIIYKEKASEVTLKKLHWAGDIFDVNWEKESEIEFEYSGQLSAEDTQEFLFVIEEITDFWTIPDKGIRKGVTKTGKNEICIDGYGNRKRNCITRTAEEIEGDKYERIEIIRITLEDIVIKMTDVKYFIDPIEK